jgi:hypothetical protein
MCLRRFEGSGRELEGFRAQIEVLEEKLEDTIEDATWGFDVVRETCKVYVAKIEKPGNKT